LRVRLVLVGIEGEINLGLAVRTAKNFGVEEIFLVSPKARIDDEEAIRFSSHAKDLLGRISIVDSLSEALKDVEVSACTSARISDRDVLRIPLSPRRFAEIAKLYNHVAVVFGRESTGLTREELRMCDVLVHIPANPEYPVLNLSQSIAVVLYELWVARTTTNMIEGLHPVEGRQLKAIRKLVEELVLAVYNDRGKLEQVVPAITHILVKGPATRVEAAQLYHLLKKVKMVIDRCSCCS